jgi:DNA-directed RNA polymerase specialized sigma24 family protein
MNNRRRSTGLKQGAPERPDINEPDEGEDAGDDLVAGGESGEGEDDQLEDSVARLVGSEWPVLAIDLGLLQDPETDPVGHAAEWRRIFTTFDPYLRFYFEKRLSYDDAQEVIGEIWHRAVRKIRTLTDPASAIFWLIKIGRNAISDMEKAKGRRLERQRVYLDALAADDRDWRDEVLDAISAECLFDDRIDRREFRRHFSELSDINQEFAMLLQVEGYSHRELMQYFGFTSEDASKSRWQWIRRKLVKALGATATARLPRV